MKKIKVNLISESGIAKGQGVHSAYEDMYNALKKNNKVSVVTNSKEESDIIHIHTIGFYSLMKLLKAKCKKVVNAHLTPGSMKGSLVLADLWLPIFTKYLVFFYNQADLVLAVSPQVKKELIEIGVKKRIEVVPNTVDIERFKRKKVDKRKYGYNKNDFIVIGVGQIQPRKGISDFIEVGKRLPEVKFIWVGGRPFSVLTAEYKKSTELMETTPKNVKFAGLVPREEMINYYSISDLFFLPSIQETFGLVVIEAAACNLPVLLRDIDVYKKIFGDNYLKAKDVNCFVKIIRKIKSDKRSYEEYRKKAKYIAEKYDRKKVTEDLVKLYKEILKGKNN